MRFIYMDEAGQSAPEPVTVVVGLVVDADRHWLAADRAIQHLVGRYVPHDRQDGFIFHAKTIFAGGREFENWTFADRRALVGEMASIPLRLGIPICLGKVRRDSAVDAGELKLSKEKFQHLLAFMLCVWQADKYIRAHAGENEVGTIVAEDVPDIRRLMKGMFREMKGLSAIANPTDVDHYILSSKDKEKIREYGWSPDAFINVCRIVDEPHFVAKNDAPLLQIVDACAFSFRRAFALQTYGVDLVTSMLGNPLDLDEWAGPVSCQCWTPQQTI